MNLEIKSTGAWWKEKKKPNEMAEKKSVQIVGESTYDE